MNWFEQDERRQKWITDVLDAAWYGDGVSQVPRIISWRYEPDWTVCEKYGIESNPTPRTPERLLELMFDQLTVGERKQLVKWLRKGQVADALAPEYVTSMLRNILDDKTETELLLRGRKKMKTVPGNDALKVSDAVKILAERVGKKPYTINEILRKLELDSPQWAQFVEQHEKKLKGKRRVLGTKAYQKLRKEQIKQEEKRTKQLLKKR